MKKTAKKDIESAVSLSFKGTTTIAPDIKQAIKKEATKVQKTPEEVLSFYVSLLTGNKEKFKQSVAFLHGTSVRISGLEPKDILEAMRNKETSSSNRREYVDFLNDAIRSRGSRRSGEINEVFNEVKHTSVNRSYGPDYTRYKQVIERNKNTRR